MMFQASYKGFVRINSFNRDSNSMRLVLLLSTPLYSWWHRGTKELDFLSKVTQPEGKRLDPRALVFDYETQRLLMIK